MELRVVSLPPTVSRTTLPRKLEGVISRVAGECASIEIRSLLGSAFTRSFHSPVK
jgi:hypothetical protein